MNAFYGLCSIDSNVCCESSEFRDLSHNIIEDIDYLNAADASYEQLNQLFGRLIIDDDD